MTFGPQSSGLGIGIRFCQLPSQQIGQEYYHDCDRGEIFYQKIDEAGYAEVSFDGASVCEFIQDIGFFHFPSRENHDDKGSERHEPAGGQLVKEVENRVAEDAYARKAAERPRAHAMPDTVQVAAFLERCFSSVR